MKGLAYLILAGFFLGITSIWVKLVGPNVSPFLLTIMRAGGAALLTLVLVFFMKNVKILWAERKYMPFLVLSGFFGVSLGFGMFISALQYVPVANVLLLALGVSPISAALLAYFFLKEKITRWEITGMIIVVLGIASIYGPEISTQTHVLGNIMALIAGICYSVFIVSLRYLEQEKIPFYAVTFWPLLLGSLFLLLFFPFEPVAVSFSGYVPLFVLMIAVSTFLAYTFYAEGLRTISAHNAPIIILLTEPIVGILLAWMVLGEIPPSYIYLGGSLIILANILVEREIRKKKLGEKPTTIYKEPHPMCKNK